MTWTEHFDQAVKDYMPDLIVYRKEQMNRHTSFRIGGPAARMACPKKREELVILDGLCRQCGVAPLMLGNGTNLLVSDRGIDTVVINTAAFLNRMQIVGEDELEADAGVALSRLALYAQSLSLTGLEFAHGIPGSLGGAICMNAGAYGGEMKHVVTEVEVLTSDGVRRVSCEAADFGYRHSAFSDGQAVVLSAHLKLQRGDCEQIRGRMEELMGKRKSSQPLEYPSAGSTFKRPEGYYAGTLIDQCGLKGLSVGGAQVSEKHAGFVINRGGATCEDVVSLIRQVQQRVFDKTGVKLEPEVKIIGTDGKLWKF